MKKNIYNDFQFVCAVCYMNIQQHKTHFLPFVYKLIIVQFDTPVPQTHTTKG